MGAKKYRIVIDHICMFDTIYYRLEVQKLFGLYYEKFIQINPTTKTVIISNDIESLSDFVTNELKGELIC